MPCRCSRDGKVGASPGWGGWGAEQTWPAPGDFEINPWLFVCQSVLSSWAPWDYLRLVWTSEPWLLGPLGFLHSLVMGSLCSVGPGPWVSLEQSAHSPAKPPQPSQPASPKQQRSPQATQPAHPSLQPAPVSVSQSIGLQHMNSGNGIDPVSQDISTGTWFTGQSPTSFRLGFSILVSGPPPSALRVLRVPPA